MTTIDELPPTTLAGVPRRLVAVAIDIPLWVIGLLVMLFLLALSNGGELSGSGSPVVVFLLVWTVLWETLWTAAGGTPGKRIAGFSVRRLDGTRLGLVRSLVRTLVKYAQVYMLIAVAISLVMIARSKRAQALHDLAAGSACFEREALELLSSPQAATMATSVPPLPAPSSTPPRATSEPTPEHRGPFL